MRHVAGLIYGNDPHYIDHLAPLCSLLEIPLIITDEEIKESLDIFYPNLAVIYIDTLSATSYIAEHYDILFYCGARALFDDIFFFQQKIMNKKIHTIWCPHGNSDKGYISLFMEGLKQESAALVYGNKMIDFFKDKGVLSHFKQYVPVGNFRKRYYLQHEAFYRNLTENKVVKHLAKDKKTILYAPTWSDVEKSSSCFDILPHLIEKLPESYNLLIKLHPNIYLQNLVEIERLKIKLETRDDVCLLENFPPIYPLLDFVDIYLGDASSIGYDFITFNKPMFLLNQNNRDIQKDKGMFLFRCAVEIKKEHYPDVYKIIDAYLPTDLSYFTDIRKEVEAYTFAKDIPLDSWAVNIKSLYEVFPDKDMNFF